MCYGLATLEMPGGLMPAGNLEADLLVEEFDSRRNLPAEGLLEELLSRCNPPIVHHLGPPLTGLRRTSPRPASVLRRAAVHHPNRRAHPRFSDRRGFAHDIHDVFLAVGVLPPGPGLVRLDPSLIDGHVELFGRVHEVTVDLGLPADFSGNAMKTMSRESACLARAVHVATPRQPT